jgi:UDP-glucose 4-epimerase
MLRTVIITGINSRLALLVAGALAAQPRTRVIGVGQELPPVPVAGVRLHQCDMRGAMLLELLRDEGADVVAHLDFPGEEQYSGARDGGGRGNVFRAIEVLGACAAAGVSRVVLRSSTLVYGAHPEAPAFIPESAPVIHGAHANLLQDYAETERVAAEFALRHPALQVAPLRCAGVVGSGVSSPLSRYLMRRPAPMMLGFDPRVQVLHAHDACVAIALAVLADTLSGPVNVASDRPLPLSQAIALAGGQSLPLPGQVFAMANLAREGPLPGVGAALSAVAGPAAQALGELPFDSDYLRYACVADTYRARALGWEPQHTAEEALRELAEAD